MKIILITGIVLILISLIKRNKYTPYIGFAFVFLIMGFQSNVQGDYYGYLDNFQQIQMHGSADTRTIESEPFHPFLMRLFSFGPWWIFVVFTTAFQTLVLIKFVNKYCNKSYQWIAAILFFFTFNMMLLQMKAMRQALSIEMMLSSFLIMDCELKKTNTFKIPWKALLIAYLAYITHNSSLICVPFLFLFWFALRKPEKMEKFGKGKQFPWIMVGIYAFAIIIKETLFRQYLEEWALWAFTDSDNQYIGYIDGSSINSFQNQDTVTPSYYVLFYGTIVYFSAMCLQKSNAKIRVFCFISILSAIGEMIFFGMGALPRIVMGLSVFSLVTFPLVISYIQKNYGVNVSIGYLVLSIIMLAKLSVPWMLETADGQFGTYTFIFL